MQRRILLTALLALVLSLLATGSAHACLKDRDSDSLAAEARGLPEMVGVITGRFERNPPLFYEMRVKRVAAELAARPGDLPLYDDIAVALDRLGRDDEAVAWIEKKHTRIAGTGIYDPNFREA
jgi:hypothetical protein